MSEIRYLVMEYGNGSFCGRKVVEEIIRAEMWWGDELNVFQIVAGCCAVEGSCVLSVGEA